MPSVFGVNIQREVIVKLVLNKDIDKMQTQQWQSLLNEGNECFHDRRWLQAELYYKEAYDVLAMKSHRQPYCSDTLMAWICTCHNLSSLFEAQGDIDMALRYLLAPHERLKNTAESKGDDEDLKLIALKALNITLSPLLVFAKKYPMCDSCQKQLFGLKKLLDSQLNTVH